MSDELELEVPISAGARSTEENVLAIYIYCPELLYEDPIDANLFAYPPHKQLFEAIKCGLEGGSWNVAVYNREIKNNGLVDLHNKLLGEYVSRVPLNSYLDELRKNYVQRECLKVLQKSMNTLQKYNELNIYALYNDLEKLQNKFQHEDDVITIASVEQMEQEWLIERYIPKYETTIIGGDGGVGKTAFWLSIVASLSAGNPCFFENPEEVEHEPLKTLYLTRENSNATNLKGKFELLGANMNNILCIGDTNMNFFKYKIGSPNLEYLIKKHRPDVLILDPLQSFVPDHVNLIARNHVHPMFDWLNVMTKKYEVTILVIMHTKKNASIGGRDRLADSSDMYDDVRQVLMVGETDEDGIKYVSSEKNNLTKRPKTILFEQVDHGLPRLVGFSDINDDTYLKLRRNKCIEKGSSKKDKAMDFILSELSLIQPEGLMADSLNQAAFSKNISQRTLERARKELIDNGKIRYENSCKGKGKGNKYVYYLNKEGAKKDDSSS